MMNIRQVEEMREFFLSRETHEYGFRIAQLKKLRAAIDVFEKELFQALYLDLRKSPEESWVTEIGLVRSELSFAIARLKKWMRPRKVRTNLLNFPSKSYVIPEPLGVVFIIGPWNYPFQLTMNPLIGAIAAGNCAVIKPSEITPATSSVIGKLIRETFEPRNVSFLEGDGAVVIPPLLESFTFDHIFFTGSTEIGRRIYKMAAERLVPVTLELGGKSPCIVEADANIRVAARRIAITKFTNAGQMCVAPDFVVVHESRKKEFLEQLQNSVKDFFGDDPMNDYSYCRIINEKQFDRLNSLLDSGSRVFGGKTDRKNLLIEPTVITDLTPTASVMQQEIFGPVLPVFGFNNTEEALSLVNAHLDPLAFYVYTESRQKEKQWLDLVPAGGSCINNSSWHLTNHHLPFGGRGKSGIGSYHGKHSFNTFSHQRAVMRTPSWFDPNIKYPPFKGRLKLFKKLIR